MLKKATKTIAMFILIALAITMIPMDLYASATAVPTAVKGRILSPSETGDTVNWVEIAQFGNYSLIVRTSYLNWYTTKGYYGNTAWQSIPYGATTAYGTSNVYKKINAWFNGTNSVNGDNLAANANLRNFTVENNVLNALGTASDENGKTNGFSIPTDKKRGAGDDIAFALSYSESVNFISNRYYTWQKGDVQSSDIAKENYKNINIPFAAAAGSTNCSGAWLRSPGFTSNGIVTAGSLSNGTKVDGRAFQYVLTNTSAEKGFLYPALWVDSSIFGVKAYTVTYIANDGTSSEIKVPVKAGDNHTVGNQNFARDGYTLAGFNTTADGNGEAYTVGQSFKVSDDVTLFAQWTQDQSSVTYDPNGGTGSVFTVPVNAGDDHTVVSQNYTRSGYTLVAFNTQTDGSGTSYSIGQSFTLTGSITLYAQWKKDLALYYFVHYHPNNGHGIETKIAIFAPYTHTIQRNGYYANGYTLGGYTTEADGSGTFYAIGDTIQLTEELTLYAQWIPTGTGSTYCTVTYISIFDGVTTTLASDSIKVGLEYWAKSAMDLGLQVPTGYRLAGWSVTIDGVSYNWVPAAGKQITENLTLYAIYIKRV